MYRVHGVGEVFTRFSKVICSSVLITALVPLCAIAAQARQDESLQARQDETAQVWQETAQARQDGAAGAVADDAGAVELAKAPAFQEPLRGSLVLEGVLEEGGIICAHASGLQDEVDPVCLWGIVSQSAFERLSEEDCEGTVSGAGEEEWQSREAAIEDELRMQLYLYRLESEKDIGEVGVTALRGRYGDDIPRLADEQRESGIRLLPEDICESIVLSKAETGCHVFAAVFDGSGSYGGSIAIVSAQAVGEAGGEELGEAPGTSNIGKESLDAVEEAPGSTSDKASDAAEEAVGVTSEEPSALLASTGAGVLVPMASSAIYVSSSGSDAGAGTYASPYNTIAKAYSAVSGGGTIYLCSDLTLSSRMVFSGSKNVTICSYGNACYTVSRASSLASTEMFAKTGTGILRLTSINIDGCNVAAQGALWYHNGGTLDFYGSGSMSNANVTQTAVWSDVADYPYSMGGGAVSSYAGTVKLDGWTISNCSCETGGGGIYIDKSSELLMSSGTVSGCVGGTYGGGIRVLSGAVTITGGTITGNSAATSGGGISTGARATDAQDFSVLNISDCSICNNTIASGGDGGAGIMVSSCDAYIQSLHMSANDDPDEKGDGIATTADQLHLTGSCYWITASQETYLRASNAHIVRRVDDFWVNNDVSSLVDTVYNVATFHDRMSIKPEAYSAGRMVMYDDRGAGAYGFERIQSIQANSSNNWGIAICGTEAYICTKVTGSVAIAGAAAYGQTLAASCASTNLITGIQRKYLWWRISPDGSASPIKYEMGNTSSYKLGEDDIGCYLVVDVSDSGNAYSASTAGPYITAQSATVAKAAFALAAHVSGEALVGIALGASAASLPGAGTTTLSYQWQRCQASDGVYADIDGATGSSYQVATVDEGFYIRCTISGENSCYTLTPSSSAPIGPIGRPSLTGSLSIAGTAEYADPANTLVASATGLPAGVVPAYRWFRDGEAIPGATSSTFIISSSDVGCELSCEASDLAGIYAGAVSATAGVVEGPQISVFVPLSVTALGGSGEQFDIPSYEIANDTGVPVYLSRVAISWDTAQGLFSDYASLEATLALGGDSPQAVPEGDMGIAPHRMIGTAGTLACEWGIAAGEGNFTGYALEAQRLGTIGYTFSLTEG